jgi:hypothetical protein
MRGQTYWGERAPKMTVFSSPSAIFVQFRDWASHRILAPEYGRFAYATAIFVQTGFFD